jgi:hypothetical protein
LKKNIKGIVLVGVLFLSLVFITPALAGNKNQNGINGYQGTNKASSQLPAQSKVPWPAGFIENLFGLPNVVEGCRAGGGNVTIFEEGLGFVKGGPCCKGPEIEEGIYAPNQCCNPPDIVYPDSFWTPGNHCLCFMMRWDGPLPI